MSNTLAIATVTRALAQVVERAASSEVSGAQVVPGRPEADAAGPRVYLFLYQVLPNASQRNNDLPSRSPAGDPTLRPTAALDLNYLVSFIGDDAGLEAHRMLGAVTRDLHARPLLSRSLVASVSTGDLALSNLADAVEPVRVTPMSLSIEDLSKVWAMFSQIPYLLSVAYQARLVLIESDESGRPALPVLSRGPDDRGVDTRIGPFPILDDIEVALADAPVSGRRLPLYPSAQLGLRLILRGRNLGGQIVRVRFVHPRLAPLDLAVPDSERDPQEIRVIIPNDAAARIAWAAGVYSVSIRTESAGVIRSSNELPLPFAPAISGITPSSPIAGAGTNLVLTLTCSPQIAAGQQVRLLLADRESVAPVPTAPTDTVAFTISNAPAVSNEFLRLRVDGVDNFLFKQQGTPPKYVFDDTQRITIT